MSGGVQWTGEDSCDERLAAIVFLPVRDHRTVGWANPYGGGPLAEDNVGASRAPRRDDTLLVRIGGKEESE